LEHVAQGMLEPARHLEPNGAVNCGERFVIIFISPAIE
jgi:hypothetical protein